MKLTKVALGMVLLLQSCGKYTPQFQSEHQAETSSDVNMSGEVKTTSSLDVVMEVCGVIKYNAEGEMYVVPYKYWTDQSECLEQFSFDPTQLGEQYVDGPRN